MGEAEPKLTTFAILAEDLPLELNTDWTNASRQMRVDINESENMSAGKLTAFIANKYGSIVSYRSIPPDKIRVFCYGDRPADPLEPASPQRFCV
jgi:hypothetical protein